MLGYNFEVSIMLDNPNKSRVWLCRGLDRYLCILWLMPNSWRSNSLDIHMALVHYCNKRNECLNE